LKRLIQRKIQDELALSILKGEVGEGDVVTVDVDRAGNAKFVKKGEKKQAETKQN
jgi:ATP-dependent Clp protease ATP-binding subunit ClpA